MSTGPERPRAARQPAPPRLGTGEASDGTSEGTVPGGAVVGTVKHTVYDMVGEGQCGRDIVSMLAAAATG
jgi:hypothetical protein